MIPVLVVAGWIVLAGIVAVVMARRGHDWFMWGFLAIVLGPLVLPLAVRSVRSTRPHAAPAPRPGGLDVLVALDGSDRARAALGHAVAMLGSSATSYTLVTVVDREAADTVRGHATQSQATDLLTAARRQLVAAVTVPVDTLIECGRPAECLARLARNGGYELIVTGSRGRGLSAAALGSVARRLVADAPVPVLVGPAP